MATDPELIKYRTELREADASLERLKGFEDAWWDYVEALRAIVRPSDGNRGLGKVLNLPRKVANAEEMRLRVISLLPTALGSYSSEGLSNFTNHNLLTDLAEFLYTIRDQIWDDSEGNTVPAEISLNRFEAKVGECKALIESKRQEVQAGRRRLAAHVEETERGVGEERKHELDRIKASQPGFWKAFKATPIGGFLGALLKSAWGKIISAILVFLGSLLIPPVRHFVLSLFR